MTNWSHLNESARSKRDEKNAASRKALSGKQEPLQALENYLVEILSGTLQAVQPWKAAPVLAAP